MTSRAMFLVIALLASAPVVASAQQPAAPSPNAPTTRLLEPGSRVWQLDFGTPKLPPPVEPAGASHWRWHEGHVAREGAWFKAPALPQVVAPAIDCAMAKPGDPAIDPKFENKHHGATRLSGLIIPVASCPPKK